MGYRLPLLLSIWEPIGGALKQVVGDFQRYITVFEARIGWGFLDNLMGEPKKCGAFHCDSGYATLALPSDIRQFWRP